MYKKFKKDSIDLIKKIYYFDVNDEDKEVAILDTSEYKTKVKGWFATLFSDVTMLFHFCIISAVILILILGIYNTIGKVVLLQASKEVKNGEQIR